MYKVGDLEFDCSTWDIKNPHDICGKTGIMFDAIIKDEKGHMVVLGDTEIKQFLDKELAQACGIDLDTLENEIYEN